MRVHRGILQLPPSDPSGGIHPGLALSPSTGSLFAVERCGAPPLGLELNLEVVFKVSAMDHFK